MFPLWDDVIAPVIDAIGPRRIVEIGALRGETTVRVLERLGPECELHVIDPEPQFDPAEHERAFPGRYRFHLGTSHEVLPRLPPSPTRYSSTATTTGTRSTTSCGCSQTPHKALAPTYQC